MKPAKHPDQAVDVVGVVAAVEKALPRLGEIGFTLLQRFSGGAVAERHGQRRHEARIVLLAVLLGVVEQVDLRVLLPLRIEALARDIGAQRRQQLDAEGGDAGLQSGHRDEHRHDGPVA
ncbi:MAG: hypothetical protein ABI781_13615 [Burkholderiales bacterium]